MGREIESRQGGSLKNGHSRQVQATQLRKFLFCCSREKPPQANIIET
jgi:hypothetical protein